MLLHLPAIIVALVLLYLGAEGLIRGSSSLGLKLGLSPLIIGLTIVTFATDAPEIFVSLKAALIGHGDLAVGNALGSNIFNVGVILGILALVFPMKVNFQLVKIDGPIMALIACLVPFVLADGIVSRVEGAALFLGAIAYTVFNIFLAKRTASSDVEAEFLESLPPRIHSPLLMAASLLGGMALLAGGAHILIEHASSMARQFGVRESLIGLTVVAAGTSLPELAASIVAMVRKEPDIALGNIIGSNVYNILGVLGISAIAAPLQAPDIQSFDIQVMVVLCVALVPLLWSQLRLQRLEGAFLLMFYCAYVTLRWSGA